LKTQSHHRAVLALTRIPNLGSQRIRIILQKAEDASEIFSWRMSRFLKIDGIGEGIAGEILKFNDWDSVDAIIKKTENLGAQLITQKDSYYPPLLRQIYDAPALMWLKGNPEALQKNGIAVIGTRSPGRYGASQAEEWTCRLVASGLSVFSGLAYGVDSIAHQTAVAEGGETVAVLGSGIDWIYPARNVPLVKKITENGGAILTEFEPGTKPDAGNFPVRNRIVSGMSLGVLVIETGVKGGSMITARSALDQNREVFVVPHPLNSEKGEGCNYLIKTGQGKLVQSIQDILVEIPHEAEQATEIPRKKNWEQAELDEESLKLCTLLSEGSQHIDLIGEKTGKATYQILPLLLDLEMKGVIRQKAGKYFELM